MNYNYDTKEMVEQLLEMSFDMDYMDYADYITDEINCLTKDLESLKGSPLYDVLYMVVEMNYDEEKPLLTSMIKAQKGE